MFANYFLTNELKSFKKINGVLKFELTGQKLLSGKGTLSHYSEKQRSRRFAKIIIKVLSPRRSI